MARVLRRPDTRRVTPDAYVAATRAAADIVAKAEAEGARILDAARAEGERRARAALDDATQRATALLLAASEDGARLRALAEPELVALALGIVERVVAAKSAVDPRVVREEARRALEGLARARKLVVRCHPDDHAELDALLANDGRVTVEPDPDLERGDVVVASDIGARDARLRTRLENVARALGRPT